MLEAETIQRMEWPTCSPDLNQIEHVWELLGRRIAARPRPPATVQDLEIALLEEWNSIPQSLTNNLIASMANRCAAVLAVRGDYTPYYNSCIMSKQYLFLSFTCNQIVALNHLFMFFPYFQRIKA
ncbi:transposable element Tcb2 transposase [Trichonephila clavipes]|nr:transposable element Tcb2 transposase [Trichonephila clavipes]